MNAFYDTTLPPEVVEAVAANHYPQISHSAAADRMDGSGAGKAAAIQQAAAPVHAPMYGTTLKLYVIYSRDLERTLRQTEFHECQNPKKTHQDFRAWLPIRPTAHDFHAAADGTTRRHHESVSGMEDFWRY